MRVQALASLQLLCGGAPIPGPPLPLSSSPVTLQVLWDLPLPRLTLGPGNGHRLWTLETLLPHPPMPSFPLTSRVRTKPLVLWQPSHSDCGRVPASLQVPGGLARGPTQQEPARHRLNKGPWSSRGSPRPPGCGRATAHVSLCFLGCRRGRLAQLSSALLAAQFVSVCDSSRAPSAMVGEDCMISIL